MKQTVFAALSGLLFAAGLAIGGMTDPFGRLMGFAVGDPALLKQNLAALASSDGQGRTRGAICPVTAKRFCVRARFSAHCC